tara:strand:- start:38 stop:421 length:384 start_codon:yes stop_codon:yes gene_type:complete
MPTGPPPVPDCAAQVPAIGVRGDRSVSPEIAGGLPVLNAAAISAGGEPKEGFPTRATDLRLGLGRVASDRTSAPGGTVGRAFGGAEAKLGGLDSGVGPRLADAAGADNCGKVDGGGIICGLDSDFIV